MFGNEDRRREPAPEFRATMNGSLALRSLLTAALLLAANLLPSAPARAQFVCTFNGIDETCVNSGTAPFSLLANPNAGGQLSATNTSTGTVNGEFGTVSPLGGNVNLTNAGSVTSLRSVTQHGGNAVGNNSGTASATTLDPFGNADGFYVAGQLGGDATATNSGSLLGGGFFVGTGNFLAPNGNATATNTASGKVATFFQVITGTNPNGTGGNATGTNAGSIGTFFQVETRFGGNAIGTNTGNVPQFFQVDALNQGVQNGGTATGTNGGTVGQTFSVFTTNGGNATGTNTGSVGGDFTVMSQGQLLSTLTTGVVTGNNSGSVGGAFSVTNTTALGGDISGTNSGSVGADFTIQTPSGKLTVFNSGTVVGGVTAISQNFPGNGNNIPTSFVNTGSIGGSVTVRTSAGGDQTFTNSGSIGGAVSLQSNNGGNMNISNSGKIGGNANFNSQNANQSNPFAAANITMANSGSIGGNLSLAPVATLTSNVNLTNSGTIGTLGGGQFLLAFARGGGTSTVGNSGTINATVFMRGAAASLTNSGSINDPGSTAISFLAGANTLTLLQGSSIAGNIMLGTGGNNTVNVNGPGLIAGNIVGAGAGNTLNFAVGPGTFSYGPAFSFSAINQVNVSSGTVILNGANSATNIAVTGGNLQVGDAADTAAKLSGIVNVTGGTLSGHGTVVGNVSVGNGATLGPGGSVGTLTIQGNLVLATAATYLVDVSATGASSTAVSGTAALGGTVQVFSSTNSFRLKSPYTILTSAGLNGTQFNGIAPIAGITEALSYTGNSIQLTLTSALTQITTPTGQTVALNANQRAVATALDIAFNATGSTGALGMIFNGNIPFNLTQASGEVATRSQQTTFDAMSLFMGVLTDPFIAGRSDDPAVASVAPGFAEETRGASAYVAGGKARSQRERDARAMFTKGPPLAGSFAQRWSVWAAGFGGSQTTDGNAMVGSNTATSRIAGAAVGADYRISPFTIAGFAFAGGGTNFSIANALGTGRSDLFQAGAYLRHVIGPAYISAALAYGWQDITTDRTVTVAAFDQLRAQFNANAFSGRVEAGYRLVTPWFGLTPYAAGQATTFDLPAYAESAVFGTNAFALAYCAKNVTDSRSELGFRTDRSVALANGILTLRGRLAWAHDFDPNRSIAATFQTLPVASFVVNGAAQAPNSALTTVAAEMKWINGWSAAASFEGEFSKVTQSYAGRGVVRYQW